MWLCGHFYPLPPRNVLGVGHNLGWWWLMCIGTGFVTSWGSSVVSIDRWRLCLWVTCPSPGYLSVSGLYQSVSWLSWHYLSLLWLSPVPLLATCLSPDSTSLLIPPGLLQSPDSTSPDSTCPSPNYLSTSWLYFFFLLLLWTFWAPNLSRTKP